MSNTVPLGDPIGRSTALETHPSWKAHDVEYNLHTMSEGFDTLELTGGFGPDNPAEDEPTEYDAAGALERGIAQCQHSPYWDGVDRDAMNRWTPDDAPEPMSDAQATADARQAAPGYFNHP